MDIVIYSDGIVHCSVCAPNAMTPEEVAQAVNKRNPTGISSTWKVSEEPFAGGESNPAPCSHGSDARAHYLMEC